jgi:AAA domain/Bifunctional DNA primase/polymerase, N-terminal
MSADFKQKAMIVVSKGVPVTPVDPSGEGKSAFLPDWPKSATTNVDQIDKWNEAYPTYSYGAVATGKPDGVWFLELDSTAVLDRIEAETGHNLVNDASTLMIRSRVGRGHLYFKNNAASLAMGNLMQAYVKHADFSCRVFNAYVVGPGSRRVIDGKEIFYEVVVDKPIAEAPLWLTDWLISQKVQKTSKAEALPRNAQGLVPKGYVHGYLVHRAGKLREAGSTIDELETSLLRIAHSDCEPKIDEEKVKQIARSFEKYPEGTTWEEIALDIHITEKAKSAQPIANVITGIEITPELLGKEFPAYDGQTPPKLPMLIDDFMPDGVTFFGSLSGTGKTWMGISITKALTTGMPLWGVYNVPQKVAVLYLIPEASDFSFKTRLKKMDIIQDETLFRYRTISQGMTKPLQDQLVVAMVKELVVRHKVLVVVDTAIRFLQAKDENSSMDNSLAKDSEVLRAIGANVLFMHHSPKASKDAAEMTLENTLRGTGDFGAMADAVYGFRRDEVLYAYGEGPEEMDVACVKARDMERPPLPFRIVFYRKPKKDEGERTVSVINETGDLGYIGSDRIKGANGNKLVALLKANPSVSLNDLIKEMKMRREAIKDLAGKMGWHFKKTPVWDAKREQVLTAKGVLKFHWTWTSGLEMSSSEAGRQLVEDASEATTLKKLSKEDLEAISA